MKPLFVIITSLIFVSLNSFNFNRIQNVKQAEIAGNIVQPNLILEQENIALGRQVSSLIKEFYEISNIPGLGVTIFENGEKVFEKHIGVRDLETGAPVTADTRFRIGSVSKAITAVTLMRVWQEGKIDLDKDIRHYVPAFPNKGEVITARQLAGHLGEFATIGIRIL